MQICLFKIVSEASVAAGVRRITAYTGKQARYEYWQKESYFNVLLNRLKVKVPSSDPVPDDMEQRITVCVPEDLQKRVDAVVEEPRRLRQELRKARSQASRAGAGGADPLAQVQDAGGVPLVAAEVPGADAAALRELVDVGRKKLPSAVFVFASREGGKVALVVGVTRDLVDRGLHAGKIIKKVAAVVGGGGGGRPEMAQAGGRDPDKLPQAIARAPEIVAALAADT